MKKLPLALLLTSVATLSVSGLTSLNMKGAYGADGFDATSEANFMNLMASPISLDLRIEAPAYLAEGATLTLLDEVSDSYRRSVGGVTMGQYSADLGRFEIGKAANGYAYLESMNITNEVTQTFITDDYEDNVLFDGNYSTWFTPASSRGFSDYFSVTAGDNGLYDVTFTELGYNTLGRNLATYLSSFDDFVFEVSSYQAYVTNFVIEAQADGTPTSISFNRIKKDRYGGINESFSGTVTCLSEVASLAPVVSSMSAEQKTTLSTALRTLDDAFSERGNFTASASYSAYLGSTYGWVEFLNYNSYYELDATDHDGLMLSDYALEDSTYGDTYVGLYNYGNSASPIYMTTGISPSAPYIGSTTSTAYYDINLVVPNPADMSIEFFEYENGTYVFDIDSFEYFDYYFAVEMIYAFYGIADYFPIMTGALMSDLTNYNFDFTAFAVTIDSNGSITSFVLDYIYAGYEARSTLTYSDFGTTDISAVPELAGCIDVVEAYEASYK